MKKKIYLKTSGVIFGGFLLFSLSGCATMNQWASWLPFRGDGASGYFQKKDSVLVESYYRAACDYQKKNQHRRAIEKFEQVLAENHGHAKAFNGMGVSYDHLHQYQKATGCYEAALRIDPGLDYVYNNLGYSLLMQGHVDGAISAFRQAIAINGGIHRYHNNLGLAYSQKGEIRLAQEEFKRGRDPVAAAQEHLLADAGKKSVEILGKGTESKTKVEVSDESSLSQKDELERVAPVEAKTPNPVRHVTRLENESRTVQSLELPADRHEVRDEISVEKILPAPVKVVDVGTGQEAVAETVVQRKSPVALAAVETSLPVSEKEAAPQSRPEQEKPKMAESIPATVPLVVSGSGNVKIQSMDIKPRPEMDQESPLQAEAPVKEENTLSIEVANGNGGYHTARKWGNFLLKKGQPVSRVSNADHFHYRKTVVYYRDGYLQEAYQLAKQIPMYQDMKMVSEFENPQVKIKVVIGQDMVRWSNKYLESTGTLVAHLDSAYQHTSARSSRRK